MLPIPRMKGKRNNRDMKIYKLSLTTEDGELLASWTIGDVDNADIPYPISRMAPASLANDINTEIHTRENANRKREARRG